MTSGIEQGGKQSLDLDKQVAEVVGIILCGGLATRMGGVAKHLLEVDPKKGVTIMDLSIQPLLESPIKRIILAGGNHFDKINTYSGKLKQRFDIQVDSIYQPADGTFNALLNVIKVFGLYHQQLLLWNGDDIIPNISIKRLYETHLKGKNKITRVFAEKSNQGSDIAYVKNGYQVNSTAGAVTYYATGIIAIDPSVTSTAFNMESSQAFWGKMLTEEQIQAYISSRSINVNNSRDFDVLVRAYRLSQMKEMYN